LIFFCTTLSNIIHRNDEPSGAVTLFSPFSARSQAVRSLSPLDRNFRILYSRGRRGTLSLQVSVRNVNKGKIEVEVGHMLSACTPYGGKERSCKRFRRSSQLGSYRWDPTGCS
jgi:hypothetical protein